MDKTKRNIIIAVTLLVPVAILAVVSVSRSSTTDINVIVAPSDANIQLESGQKLQNNHRNKLKSGNYQVTISRDGFNDKLVNLYVDEEAPVSLTAILQPKDSINAKKLLSEPNQRLITAIESFDGGILSDQFEEIDNFKLSSCPSIRYPHNEDIKAVCIEGLRDQNYTSALLKIPQRNYMEILYGSPSQYNVYDDNDVHVQYVSTLRTDKPTLHITVINPKLLDQPADVIIESINKSLEDRLYQPENYYFTYGNLKLGSKSTIPEEFDDEDDHLHAPYEVPGVPRE